MRGMVIQSIMKDRVVDIADHGTESLFILLHSTLLCTQIEYTESERVLRIAINCTLGLCCTTYQQYSAPSL